jgi:hypothetical protein
MEVGVQLHAPATLTKGKGPSPLDRKLGVTQLWPGHGDEEKKILFSAPTNSKLDHQLLEKARNAKYRPNPLVCFGD